VSTRRQDDDGPRHYERAQRAALKIEHDDNAPNRAASARERSLANPAPLWSSAKPSNRIKALTTIQNTASRQTAGYDNGAERYPVLYLLDAETHFHYASAIEAYLSGIDSSMPKMLVVGIASGDQARRIRDLTPPSIAEMGNRFSPAAVAGTR
jgi:hypothetical protein